MVFADVYLLALSEGSEATGNREWMQEMENFFSNDVMDTQNHGYNFESKIEFYLQHDHDSYLGIHLIIDFNLFDRVDKIAECKKQIRLGESYELCLTNKIFSRQRPPDALEYPNV